MSKEGMRFGRNGRNSGKWSKRRIKQRGKAKHAASYGGVDPIVVTQAKVGRNDPCPCGSGSKHKRCCA